MRVLTHPYHTLKLPHVSGTNRKEAEMIFAIGNSHEQVPGLRGSASLLECMRPFLEYVISEV